MNAMLGGVVTSELRWQVGSAEGFEALVHARLDGCYRLAAVLLGDRAEAEDAVHDAVVRAQRGWGSLRDSTAAAAWLDRIVVNQCRDRLRRRRVGRAILAAQAPVDLTSAAFDAGAAERAALRDAIAALSVDHRVVVVLRYLLDLTVDEIAVRTETPAGTVKSRLHHALRDLRAAYDAADRRDDR